MKRNMHAADRIVRAVLAAAAVWLAIAVGAGTADGVIALVFAAIMAATAISGFCPLYLLLSRLSERRKLA
jgi:Inner membrane protein YgaP-like, transmembrane domain